MKNTRTCQRIRRRFRVALSGTPAFTVDVSPRGFCMEMLRVPGVGTPVSGSIRVKDTEYSFTGKVVWARPGDAQVSLRGRLGVRFTDLPRSDAGTSPFTLAIQ